MESPQTMPKISKILLLAVSVVLVVMVFLGVNTPGASAASEPQDGASHNALRRRGVPDDVAGVVLFLCSDLSGFVTGQALRVNGGAI